MGDILEWEKLFKRVIVSTLTIPCIEVMPWGFWTESACAKYSPDTKQSMTMQPRRIAWTLGKGRNVWLANNNENIFFQGLYLENTWTGGGSKKDKAPVLKDASKTQLKL